MLFFILLKLSDSFYLFYFICFSFGILFVLLISLTVQKQVGKTRMKAWPMGVPREEADQVFQTLLTMQDGLGQVIFANMVRQREMNVFCLFYSLC
jgi:hypothetical protein